MADEVIKNAEPKLITPKRIVAAALIFMLIACAIIALLPKGDNYKGNNPMMKSGDMPILIAHGGGNREFPDNTLEAFYNAYSVDKNVMMETDVSITKDGVVILSHDTKIDRKTNNVGDISEWNYTDLIAERVNFGYTNPTDSDDNLSGERKLFVNENGEHVTPLDVEYPEGVAPRDSEVFLATTLEELITAFPNNRINVEIKQSGELGIKCLDEVLRLLEKHDSYERVVLASFHNDIYDEFTKRRAEGSVPERFMCSPGIGGVVKYYIPYILGFDIFFNDPICVFQLPTEEMGIKLATERLVKNAHKHNIAVHYWTVNDPDEMRYLIEIGADGIMTDYPHRLAAVYAEYAD